MLCTDRLSHGQGNDGAVLKGRACSQWRGRGLGAQRHHRTTWGTGVEVRMTGSREHLGLWVFVTSVHQGQSVACPAHLKQTRNCESVTVHEWGSDGIGRLGT